MAAILCESLGKILKGSCDAVGKVCTLPCRMCGVATEQVTMMCRSPFCLYLSVALGLNLPPVVFAGMAWFGGASSGGDGGCSSGANWILLNALLCAINMIAAAYISAKITYEPEGGVNDAPFVEANVYNNETEPQKQSPSLVRSVMESTINVNDTRSRSLGRVKEILCYDPWVALYIVIGLFYCVWQTIGWSRSRDVAGCGGELEDHLVHSLMCGFLFISLGASAFACSLCCLVK